MFVKIFIAQSGNFQLFLATSLLYPVQNLINVSFNNLVSKHSYLQNSYENKSINSYFCFSFSKFNILKITQYTCTVNFNIEHLLSLQILHKNRIYFKLLTKFQLKFLKLIIRIPLTLLNTVSQLTFRYSSKPILKHFW